ncbi:MAG TPA: HAD-IA family hydrolase [Candidatus Limnocylindria bacterium]|nr:HAD-IA family hydrolase [Candidatus Limnocylindria bacterium]
MSQAKSYRYILLDWDGNLAQTLDIWLGALKKSLEKRSYQFADEEIGANFTLFKERMEARGIADVDIMIAEADAIATKEAANVELYPDVLVTLTALHGARRKVALVTTSRHDQIDPLLTKYKLRELFNIVVCGDDVTHHKPHPEPIEKALQLLGAGKEDAIMVGDSASDVKSAHRAGIDSVLFFPPTHSKFYDAEEMKKLDPTYVIEDLREIVRIALG